MGGGGILESACRLFVREATNWSQGYYRKDMLFAIVKKKCRLKKAAAGHTLTGRCERLLAVQPEDVALAELFRGRGVLGAYAGRFLRRKEVENGKRTYQIERAYTARRTSGGSGLYLCRAAGRSCGDAGVAGGHTSDAGTDGGVDGAGPLRLCQRPRSRHCHARLAAWAAAAHRNGSFLPTGSLPGREELPPVHLFGRGDGYTPSQPFRIRVVANATSAAEAGYQKLFLPCGGADAPRPVKLRQRGSDGKWLLWEQYLLTGVRLPKAEDPWA